MAANSFARFVHGAKKRLRPFGRVFLWVVGIVYVLYLITFLFVPLF
ncbi:MAG: hypothetical protein OXC81_07275 [Betaproteobacteria bacterium]|nr:hypothetical protein [Betaproteobacteria bacterium]